MLFVSTYPNSKNEKDGMIQRIKAIDDAYCDIKRTYLDISFRKNLIKSMNQHGLVTIYQLNFFIHTFTILKLLIATKVIYVHSVYNAFKALPVYFFKNTKIITDMHGAVPEELEFCGNVFVSKIFKIVERIIIHRSWKIISVTKEMANHFASKYARDTSLDFVIPIISPKYFENHIQQKIRNINEISLVIYAGGILKWQNVPLMLEAVKKNNNVRYRFLTGSPKVMHKMAASVGLHSLDIQSVSPEKVFEHYKEADYGFLLRDDHLLNRVACPTKAIEYMSSGVIPIVLSDKIGDLKTMGYRYITLNTFLSGVLPDQDELEEMRKSNMSVTKNLAEMMSTGLATLKNTQMGSAS